MAEVTIGGKTYELAYTMLAKKEIRRRFGGEAEMIKAITAENTDVRMENMLILCVILVDAGIQRRNITLGLQEKPISDDYAMSIVEYGDMVQIVTAVQECLSDSTERIMAASHRSEGTAPYDDGKN